MQQVKSIIIAIIFAFAASLATQAQDIIVTVKAEKIEAKITEVDIEVVRYKQFDYQDGPTYIIKKSDIDSIMFQNGEIMVFEQQQTEAEPQHQEVEETKSQEENAEATGENPIDYEQFKNQNDRQMSAFLKENDPKNYEIFNLGEMKREMGRDLLISGLAFTGAGVAVLGCWVIVIPFTAFIGFFSALMGNSSVLDFLNSWIGYFPWIATIAISAVAIGQPFLIASIVLKSQGKVLKWQAKNNYENNHFKYNTSSLNFNFYPNGFGISLKF